ncbi:MAG: CotH kinase family protein [Flavobacteriaceae bacterium]|jgi:hypothetical protein|nr:CotH kinase family protein [Flavobacteriaceae bacterium]
MKKNLLTSFFLLIVFNVLHSQNIVINELITSNSNVITDDDGSYEDWVELYNAGTESVSLLGYGLSDSSNPYKWVFPDYSIQPGEYLLVWCSNKDRTNPELPLHTNFAISAGGETITLTQPDGTTVDQIPPVIIPQNHSYGRETDGSDTFVIFPIPTPGATNYYEESEPVDEVSPPVFSVNSGFYTNGFTLTLSHPDPEATIIYTLDGSEPDENNLSGITYLYKNQYPQNPGDGFGEFLEKNYTSILYESPIDITDRSSEPNKISDISTTFHVFPYYLPEEPVLKSTVVRTKAIKNNISSTVITKNYFVNPQGADRFSLPVVSLNFDEDLFFDYEDGIHVAGVDFDMWRTNHPNSTYGNPDANYNRSGSSTEFKGNFSYYLNTEEVLNQDIGIRIHGGFTRTQPNKSLRLYARSEHGNSTFDFPFFDNEPYNSYNRLILRNSGNDHATTYFLDGFIHRAVKHLKFETQSYQPATVFINGEYWGMLNFRERYDDKYFKRVFDINSSEIDHVEISGIIEAKEGDLVHYEAMMDYVENNTLTSEENYNFISTLLDPINFADYYITEIYINNTDWLSNNVELFRRKTSQFEPNAPYGKDGRWRWILKDTDVSFGMAGSYEHNTLAFATEPDGSSYPNPAWATLLFRRMLENDDFKLYFINRFADLLNTTFIPERLESIFYNMKNTISEEFPEHIIRWKNMDNVQTWHDYCTAIINFASQRPAYQRNHIREKFDIQENINAYLYVDNSESGFIKINTIEINPSTPGVSENPYPWTGIYFKDIPVTLKAIPLPGYQFSHWSGISTSTEDEITITPTSNFVITAHFVPAEVIEEPVYYWFIGTDVPNDTPLTTFEASYEANNEAYIEYASCLEGYPFNATHPNWRKASMERRNSPTDINYIPEANEDIAFEDANMRGIQIKQPFQNNGLENMLIFHTPTNGYKEIVLAFAAKDEGAAQGIVVDYNIAPEGNTWITDGLSETQFSLSSDYELFRIDFSELESVNNNENFKVRVRFIGDNLTAENGDRVTFNNFGVLGKSYDASIQDYNDFQVVVFPNPVADDLKVVYNYGEISYQLFSIDGKQIQNGRVENYQIAMSHLNPGIYFLVLEADGQSMTKKIIKK